MYDEEELLGFPIWAAELEVLAGQIKSGTRAEPAEYFELLQKLLVTLDRESRQVVKEHQRRCDDQLFDILISGAPPPVRKLACAVLCKLYLVGDSLPLFSRVGSLLSVATAKDVGQRPPDARSGVLECLAALCTVHGRSLGTRSADILAAAIKHSAKSSELPVRRAALLLAAATVRGAGGGDHRQAVALQADALKLADRAARDKGQPEVRVSAAEVLSAIATSGGAAFWANGGSLWAEAQATCLQGLDDPSPATRAAFARALGEMAAAARSPLLPHEAMRAQPKRVPALQRVLNDSLASCLIAPMASHASGGKREACTALVQAWAGYVAQMQAQEQLDEAAAIDLAVKAVEMLGRLAPDAAGGVDELGSGQSSGERPHAQACVLYILGDVLLGCLSEAGQRQLLLKLTELLASESKRQVPVLACALEGVRLLLDAVGEVPPEDHPGLVGALMSHACAPAAVLRCQAASALAALAIATPSMAAAQLRQAIGLLKDAIQAMMAAGGGGGGAGGKGQGAGAGGSGGGSEAQAVMAASDALVQMHGASVAIAALVAASKRLVLGIPASLLAEVSELSKAMISSPVCRNLQGWSVERQGGYSMLGALTLALPPEALATSRMELLTLWLFSLGKESAQQLSKRVGSSTGDDEAWQRVLAPDFHWRSASLEALHALIATSVDPSSHVPKADLQQFIKSAVALLRPTLDAFLQHPAMQDPQKGRGGVGSLWTAAAAQLQLRLLQVYGSIPNSNAFAKDHEALIKMCARTMRGASPSGDTASSVSHMLKAVLKAQDSVLGPWETGSDPREEALHCFTGSPGAPTARPWEAGGLQLPGDDLVTGGSGGSPPYPQFKSLGASLLEAQVGLLSKLLAVVSETNQALMVDMLVGAASWGGNARKAPKEPGKRFIVVGSVAAAVLAGMDRLLKKSRGHNHDPMAQRLKHLADLVAEEAVMQGTAGCAAECTALQRCAAELYGIAGSVASDAYSAKLARDVCRQMAETTVSTTRQALALGAGCLHRTGGVNMQMLVPPTVHTLTAVVGGSSPPVKLWACHGLWLIANAAGPVYIPHVKDTLSTMSSVMMGEESYFTPGMRPTIGRLANALVAVMGPEFSLGSTAYVKIKSAVREMQATEGVPEPVCGIADATAAEMERVLYAQMLILFAPHAVEPRSQLPLLLQTLRSRQPPLRQAAAATLRHLSERDPGAVLPEHIEGSLLAALDSEMNDATSRQIQATLQTLMHSGVPTEPLHWLNVCSDIANAMPPAKADAMRRGTDGSGGAPDRVDDDDDDEDDDGFGRAPQPAAPSPAPGPTTSSDGSAVKLSTTTPRLRTRLFAAQCLLELPLLMAEAGSGGAGDGSAAARAEQVRLIAACVDVGYKLATVSGDALRPLGLRLLQEVVAVWGEVEDPMGEPGSRLLEQHQAQIVSALRVSLGKAASPPVMAAGASLAANFLEKGMASRDEVLLQRLMGMLIQPLLTPSAEVHSYAEWVVVRGTVALLEANAHCTVFAANCGDAASRSIITSAQAPNLGFLLELWCALLQDFSVVESQPPTVWSAYKPKLLTSLAPGVVAEFRGHLDRAWLPVLDAASVVLLQVAGDRTHDHSERWQLLTDVCFLALALTSSDLEGGGPHHASSGGGSAGGAMGQRRSSVFSVAGRIRDFARSANGTGADGDSAEGYRFVIALGAFRRVVQAAGLLPSRGKEEEEGGGGATNMSAERAINTLNLCLDLVQQLLLPMMGSLAAGRGGWSATYSLACRALAEVVLQVILVSSPHIDGDEELSASAMEATLRLLALAVRCSGPDEATGGLQLVPLPGLQEVDAQGLSQALAVLLSCLEALRRASPRLLAPALVLVVQLLQSGGLAPGHQSDAAVASFQKLVASALEPPTSAAPPPESAPKAEAAGCNGNGKDGSEEGNGKDEGEDREAAAAGPRDALVAAASVRSLCSAAGKAADEVVAAAAAQQQQQACGSGGNGDGGAALAGKSRMLTGLVAAAVGAGGALYRAKRKADVLVGAADGAGTAAAADDGEYDDDGFGDMDDFVGADAATSTTAAAAAANDGGGDGADEFVGAVGNDGSPSGIEPGSSGQTRPGTDSVVALDFKVGDGDEVPVTIQLVVGAAGSGLAAGPGGTPGGGEASVPAGGEVSVAGSDAAGEEEEGVAVARALEGGYQCVLDLVAALMRLPITETQAPVVQVVLQYVQAAAAESPPGAGAEWAARLFAQIAPSAASRVHDLMTGGDASQLPAHDVAAVADVLKLLVAGSALAGSRADAAGADSAQQGVLALLVPLLVEVASPTPSAAAAAAGGVGRPHVALADSALKLVTHLATSPQTGGSFKAVVAALPQATKQRLQAALQAQASAQASAQAAKQAAARPAIQLRNFAAPPAAGR